MCLIALAWRTHPRYPFVLAANRDEFHHRTALPAARWDDAPGVLAGRDVVGGGTWLGVTRRGRFAALTNFRDPTQMRADRPSRGPLVADFLRGNEPAPAYLDRLAADAGRFNGFNLIVGELYGAAPGLHWFSNVGPQRRTLGPGVSALSNHWLDTPWPKVLAAREALQAALCAQAPDEQALWGLLADERQHPDDVLPETGVPLAWERALSAAHIRADGYGTRCSTVITLRTDGRLTFDEQTWLPGASTAGRGPRRRFALALE